jgi:hypothetical protein
MTGFMPPAGRALPESYINANRITHVRITCDGCHTQVTVPVASGATRPVLRGCPSCNKEFPQQLTDRLRGLRDLLRQLQESASVLELKIEAGMWESFRREVPRPKDQGSSG